MTAVYIVIGLVVIIAVAIFGIYNSLVRLRNQTKNAWAQIDVQLKRRHDLIPNLVETAKGYMKHERETLEAVTKARNLAQQLSSSGAAARGKAEGELSSVLSRLLAVSENYPDLKANQNFLSLQEELSSTENKVGFSRQFYNDAILRLNNKIQMFPSNIIASITGFKTGEFFEITVTAERQAPKVNFS